MKVYDVYNHSTKQLVDVAMSREEAEYILSECYMSNTKDVCEIIERNYMEDDWE